MTDEARQTITVTGHGRVSRPADEARVELGLRLVRPTAREARADGAATMERVLSAIERIGLERGEVRTAHLALGPSYEYPDGEPRLAGYQLSNQVSITVRRIEEVAAVVDAAIEAGATSLDGVRFHLADPGDAHDEALAIAVRDARRQAEAIAAAAGLRLAGVVSIEEDPAAAVPPGPVLARMELADAGSTPVLPGTTEVEAHTRIVYAMRPTEPGG